MGSGPSARRPGRAGAAFALLGAALLVAVAGCSPSDDPPPCPRVSVLQQARVLTLYGDGPGRDLSDVSFEIELRGASGECDYDVDEEEGGGVMPVEFALPIQVTRGPAARTDRVSVPYFVALTDVRRQVVAKEIFTLEVVFAGTENRARRVEEIVQWIPLGPGEPGIAYETLVGIQYTPEQLEDSRRGAR